MAISIVTKYCCGLLWWGYTISHPLICIIASELQLLQAGCSVSAELWVAYEAVKWPLPMPLASIQVSVMLQLTRMVVNMRSYRPLQHDDDYWGGRSL